MEKERFVKKIEFIVIFSKYTCKFVKNMYNKFIYTFLQKTMSDIILPYGEQKDGSVIDLFGNVLSLDDRLTIIEQVE